MSWFSDFLEYRKAKALSRITFPGAQYGSTGETALAEYVQNLLGLSTSGTKINFTKEVGDLRLSSLAMSGANWVGRNLNTARMRVVTLDADNKETEVKDHPLPALWKNPNPWYSGKQLLSAIGLSNVIDGGAYLLKLRSRMGQINQLWYEPHWTIRPRWPQDGSQFIAYYEILRNGIWNRIEVDDVFFTSDRIDPETRRGMNGTAAMMREYYTDQQAAKFSAMLLRNGLVPPIVITVGAQGKDGWHAMPKDIFALFRKDAEARLSGDSAAKPFFINGPAEVQKLGFEYDKVGMSEIRNMPKERFCSVMGISPHSLHFMSDSETYDNVRQYLRYDYLSYIVALQSRLADDITRDDQSQMGAHLLQPGEILDWDYSQVELMQQDTSAEWERIEGAFKSRIIDQAEARDGIGYKFDESHKGVYYPVPSNNLTISPLEELPEARTPVTLTPADKPQQLLPAANGNGKHAHVKAAGDEGAGALDALVAGAVSRLKKALTLLPESVDWRGLLANIQEAYALRDIDGVMAAIPFEFMDAEMEELIHDALLEAVETTGTKALMDLPHTGLVPRFDMKNPQVINWAERHAAEQVTGIGTESRAAIRGLISRSVSEGIDAKSTARMIREQIGLNERQAETIALLRDKLIKDGVSPSRIEKLIEAATKRAIRQRAEMIARTEIQAAANHGLQEGWRQAAQQGLLDPTRTQRVWILSGNACPLCHDIKDANSAMGLEGTWVGGDGIETPPAHP